MKRAFDIQAVTLCLSLTVFETVNRIVTSGTHFNVISLQHVTHRLQHCSAVPSIALPSTASLQPSGPPGTAAVLRDTIKGTFCRYIIASSCTVADTLNYSEK